ncbi:MAG: hypothetical protein ACPLXL_01075 [Minisyncoccia bacterium]
MTKIRIFVQKGKTFEIEVTENQDFLKALDIFLKKYKILKKEIKDWHLLSYPEKFLDYQINLAILKALNFIIHN